MSDLSTTTRRAPAAGTLVLVTGGTRGIGRILASAFAGAGYAVALTGRDAARAEQAATEIAAELATGVAGEADARTGETVAQVPAGSAARVRGLALDVADAAAVQALPETLAGIEEGTGTRLGVVVNNAGLVGRTEGPPWEADYDDIEAVIRTNVLGPFFVAKALAPVLMAHSAADGTARTLIDLNSGSGAKGTPAYAAYSASKAALFRLADAVDHYGRAHGLRIFEMSPGVIRSDMTAGMPMHAHRGEGDWTDPADLTGLALALASGRLDDYTGRYVRAGADDLAALESARPAEGERRLGLG
ncbi:SDR family NAD(P)-dependent oxidoreductase [Sediminivirga luteola]|uniref:3-ketoacyl-ACP reductase n=1 Tax=Sediminivirga luteola TaxID=1774748 RepID=A0A8J2U0I9_9MICO|nr:SDR family oxidoreductase [Sediminivirga luteola]MCI2265322.1 SDR family oxidoreductase [Sediminivirga luteola]GGA24854.1 3-ketoacyl-ACP reductase [Sediminivirga luteola]